jgi:mono/diheme cytochrome c family protein
MSFRFLSRRSEGPGEWNATEVYRKVAEVKFCCRAIQWQGVRLRATGMKVRWLITASALAASATAIAQSQPRAPVGDEPAKVVGRYCVTCHNNKLKTGGMSLERLDARHPAAGDEAALETWEKAVRKVRVGMMPPDSAPQPSAQERAGLVAWLESELDRAAAADLHPGSVGVHRMNRAEYGNAIRDLLDLRIDAASMLPADDSAFGFDNIAETLGASPALVEQYLSAAGKIAALAVGDPGMGPAAEVLRIRQDESQNVPVPGMPVGTEGGTVVHTTLPLDGEYELDVKYMISNLGAMKGLEMEHEVEIAVDGKRIHKTTIGGDKDFRALMRNITEAQQDVERRSSTRVSLTAGPHEISVGFVYQGVLLGSARLEPFVRSSQDNLDATGHPHIETLTITGPFHPTGVSDTPSRRRIFVCRPPAGATEAQESACARTILKHLARRAYRGNETAGDIDRLMQFFAQGRAQQVNAGRSFEGGVQTALERLLASPKFTFRVERDPEQAAPGSVHALSGLELASRLSFFLWSSIPDDTLLNAASAGVLASPQGLEMQVRRMLADPKAHALTENFAGQWLYLRNLEGIVPNSSDFPDFDDNLRQAFRRETELFFGSIMDGDRNVLDLMTADYTFLNERLARHYRIPYIYGDHFRRVTLNDKTRWGLLGKGSTLMVSSHTDRTSPVVRGKWVLENLLGTPPPPPPPDVPPLNEGGQREGRVLTMRERMAEHRANPPCAGCHKLMDPIGLSLENFDAVGAWRDQEKGGDSAAIDASGKLLDGTEINGPVALREALVRKPEIFVSTVVEKMMVYALGRGLTAHDMPAVRKVVRDAGAHDYRFSQLVLSVVDSEPFRMREKPVHAALRTTPVTTARMESGPGRK